ncbi:MAG: D-alanine--D-alanine ligase family protein [Pseudomonadota bacterium]
MPVKESAKIKVAVLYGGRSAEHEVSLSSAASVIKNLDKNKFAIVPVAIDKQGNWWLNDFTRLTIDESVPVKTSTSEKFSFEALPNRCDVVFPVLHGTFAEDGTIQGLLELIGVAYVGANVLGSAIGMDKEIAKCLALAANIPVVPFIAFNSGQWLADEALYQAKIEKELAYPLFVKPVNAGSSLGITKVKKSSDLLKAIQLAFEYDTKIIIEKAMNVHEIEVAVLENTIFGKEPEVSVVGEIIPKLSQHGFYSYEAKYIDEQGAVFAIPAVVQEGQSAEIQKLASKIFTCLACEGMARIDFFIEKDTKKIYFNEINTIPGFTKISMYPKLWRASGISYQQLLTRLLELALTRHWRKTKLRREYHTI